MYIVFTKRIKNKVVQGCYFPLAHAKEKKISAVNVFLKNVNNQIKRRKVVKDA